MRNLLFFLLVICFVSTGFCAEKRPDYLGVNKTVLNAQSVPPVILSTPEGMLWWDSGTHSLKGWNGSAWKLGSTGTFSDIELSTISAADGTLALTLSNSTALATFAGVIDVSDVEAATVSARDGTLALTLTNSTGVVAFSATPTGTNLDFSGTLYGHTVKADHIADEAGTGGPSLTNGATFAGDLLAATDNARDIGVSGTEFKTAWVQNLDDGDGTVSVTAILAPDSIVSPGSIHGHAIDSTGDVTASVNVVALGEVRSNDYKDDTGHGGMVLDAAGDATFHNNVAVTTMLDTPDIETATVSARDGTLALTLTNSTGNVAFSATPTGTNLDFSGTLYAHTVQADHLTNEAGNGAPSSNFSGGTGNEFWGDTAGLSSTAVYSTALGGYALRSTNGDHNTAVGHQSLNASDGSYNSAFGRMALESSPGSNNTAAGYYALRDSTGSDNTCFGVNSGTSVVGSSNSSVGRYALNKVTGSENTALGWGALSESNGSYNVAAGSSAMNTSPGSNNVSIGTKSLYFAAGSNNVAVGHRALEKAPGSNNTVVGYHVAEPAYRTVNYLAALGSMALEDVTTGASNLAALGYMAGHTATNQTNQLYLGGWDGGTQYPLTLNWETTAVSASLGVRVFVNRTEYILPLMSTAGTLTTTGQFVTPKKSDLTIATAAITVTGAYHTIAAEGGVADTLSTINGGVDGSRVLLRGAAAVAITVDEAGNILVPGASITIDNTGDTAEFIYSGGITKWVMISAADNN